MLIPRKATAYCTSVQYSRSDARCAMSRKWAKVVAAGVCVAALVGVAQFRAAADALAPGETGLEPAGPDDAAGPKFLVEPYLQYATRTTMTVMWETEQPCTAELEYGTTFPPQQVVKVE